MAKTGKADLLIDNGSSQDIVIFSGEISNKENQKELSSPQEIFGSSLNPADQDILHNVSLTNIQPDEHEIDPITLAIREQILLRQLNAIKNEVVNISSESEKQKISDMNPAEFKQYAENSKNKEILESALKNETVQKELHEIEVEGYKTVHTKFQDKFKNIEWKTEQNTETRTNEVTGPNGDVYCKLTETTHKQANIAVGLSNGTQKTINSYRTIDFPKELYNKGPMHLSMAVKDADGKNIAASKALFFTAHYDESGKLTEVSSPQPIKFAGIGPDAVGYVEKDGQIYTLSVSQGKYEEMMQEVVKNNGIGFDISEQAQITAQDKIVTKKAVGNIKEKQELNQSSTIESHPQEKSNYKVLQDNKNATLEFAGKFTGSKPIPVLPEEGLQNKLNSAKPV